MAKKIKDNAGFLSALLAGTVLLAAISITKGAGYLPSATLAVLSVLILLRIGKVLIKEVREYLNGPKRFCAGRGIEIGSGSNRMLKGSILVDVVDSFSNDRAYKVDYLADAHDLPKIETGSLDYVCASHVLEHLTNPIKAVIEWLRVLRRGGVMWLKIPDKRKTFDKPRERTLLSHLIDDFDKDVAVDDPTHIDDNNRNTDPPRAQNHPYIHNHVWIPEDVLEMFDYISREHAALEIVSCRDNTCRNSQDFWIVVKKL